MKFDAQVTAFVAVAALSAIVVAVSRGRRFIERPGVRTWLARLTGAALVAMGVRLALEKR